MTDPHVESIRAKLLQRSQRGIEKYGVTTARTDLDLPAWLTHLQEELLDAAVYAERLLAEARGPKATNDPAKQEAS